MSYYEYRVVPAPKDAPKAKGVKGIVARYAQGMEAALNAEGLDRWEYQRSETMQAETKRGLFRKSVTEPVTVLIFRRWVETAELPHLALRQQHSAAPSAQEVPGTVATMPAAGPAPTAPDPQSGLQQTPALSAQREPRGALRPVPGPARD